MHAASVAESDARAYREAQALSEATIRAEKLARQTAMNEKAENDKRRLEAEAASREEGNLRASAEAKAAQAAQNTIIAQKAARDSIEAMQATTVRYQEAYKEAKAAADLVYQ